MVGDRVLVKEDRASPREGPDLSKGILPFSSVVLISVPFSLLGTMVRKPCQNIMEKMMEK